MALGSGIEWTEFTWNPVTGCNKIVGGESGPRTRPMDPEWATDIRDQCAKAGVAFFFKQWGGKNKKRAGRVLESKTYDAMPVTSEVGI